MYIVLYCFELQSIVLGFGIQWYSEILIQTPILI